MICVNSVSVFPKSITLKVGDWYYSACAEICPTNADCRCVTWHSDNASVASVNASSGYIYANRVGTARIYATATDGSGCSDYLTVTVSNTVPVTSVTLNRSSLSLEEGDSASLSATVCPDNATNKNVNWTSSNNGVATVNNGIITAVSKGSARITATAADGSGKSASCLVSVTGDILVTSIELTPSNTTLRVGYSIYPSVTVCPSDAAEKSFTWSSANSNIASVNPNSGLVYAKAVGTTTIYATACDGSGVCGCCTVRVIPVYVQDIVVCPETLTLDVGESACLEATVYPVNATNPNISWTSGDCNIADVDANGCVTGKAPGTTCICANAVDGSDAYGCCTVIVHTVPVSQIEVIPNTLTVNIGEKYYLNKTVSPNNATNKGVIWTSSNTGVATVNDEGEVIGIDEGSAIITATSQDNSEIYATCAVTVKIPVSSIAVSPTSAILNKGDIISLSATASPSNATNKGVIWTSGNTGVATVNDEGEVIGIDEGSAIITATSQDNSEIYGTCTVTVKIPVTSILVSPTSTVLKKDDTLSLVATISPSNATNKDVTWTSSNTNVVSVDASGNVRGNDFGTAIITATSVEKSSAQTKCIITVVPNVNNTNVNFFSSMLNELLDYANGYAPNKGASDKQLLVLQYIRHIKYGNGLWPIAAGSTDSAFVNYVNGKNPNMNTIFNGNENSYGNYLYDVEGNKIDFYHLVATLNGLLYNTPWEYNLLISETEINDMCGWAGDLQQLIKNNIYPVSVDEDIYNKTYSRLGNDNYAFSMSDFRADIDAINIYNGIDAATAINKLIAYYSGNSCTQRYSLSKSKFGNNNSATYAVVRPYTRKTSYPWVTEGLTISESQANAMAQAFCDFLWGLINAES